MNWITQNYNFLHVESVPLPHGTFSLVIELVIYEMVYIFTFPWI